MGKLRESKRSQWPARVRLGLVGPSVREDTDLALAVPEKRAGSQLLAAAYWLPDLGQVLHFSVPQFLCL